MLLHDNKDDFEQIILQVSNSKGIDPSIIEKDYYVTILLKELAMSLPAMIFKGGTSLSKCHRIIKRFSEDIDITLDENHLTQGNKQRVKEEIVKACNKFNLKIVNQTDIKSRMDYNNYKISYPTFFAINGLKAYVEIDTIFSIRSFPDVKREATSFIYDYLKEHNHDYIVEKYCLAPFTVRVQSIERTLIDKVFALCDYFIEDRKNEMSRHIYDLYKLFPLVKLDYKLKSLVAKTRKARIESPFCISAKESINIIECLKNIIRSDYFKSDYKEVTSKLLFEEVTYEQAKGALIKIVQENLFL